MDHRTILNAYIQRLSPEQLVRLSNMQFEAVMASNHLGLNAQLDTQMQLLELVGSCIDNLSLHDHDTIKSIVTKAIHPTT